jgi:hypothetical protein
MKELFSIFLLFSLCFIACSGDDDESEDAIYDENYCKTDSDCNDGEKCHPGDGANEGICLETCETNEDCGEDRLCEERVDIAFKYCNLKTEEDDDSTAGGDDDDSTAK